MPPRFPRFSVFERPYVSEIPRLKPGFEGVKQAAREGFEYGINSPAGAYDSRYGRSIVTTRTPAPLKEGMSPAQTAARLAGRAVADAATFSSQGAYYAINHPAAIAQEVIQRGFRGIGASKTQAALTALGVGTTLAIGSKWYGTNPLDYFRPQGYQASSPDPNNPRQTNNPAIELFERFRGRRGQLLPYDDFIKENNLNPNDFTYAKYRDLQRFQRNQVATEAPIGYDTLNKELGLGLTRDQFYGKAPIERHKLQELLYKMGVPDQAVRREFLKEPSDDEWYKLQQQGLKPQDYVSINLSSIQEKAGLNLGAERDPSFMSGIVRYSNNPYYGPGGAVNTFGVDTTVGALVGAGMAGATAYSVIRNQNQTRYQKLSAKVRPLANGQIDDSALTARERVEYQRLQRAFADPQTRLDQQRAAELESVDRVVSKTRLEDYPLSQTRSPDRLAQLDPVQLRNEARSRGIRVTPDVTNEYLIDRIMDDNVRRGFSPGPDSPQVSRSPRGSDRTQKPAPQPPPQSQPRSAPSSRPMSAFEQAYQPPPATPPAAPKTTSAPPSSAYEQAYQAAKKTNLRTPGEIVDKVLQYAPGLPSDDATREAIANQFLDRMRREASPPPGSDIGFRSPEMTYNPMSGRQSLKSRMRGGMSGMGNMDMGLFGGGGGRSKAPTYDPAQVIGEAKQQIDRWMQSPDRKLELRVGAENPTTGQGALYLYARKGSQHLEGQRTPVVEFANIHVDPSLQRQGLFKSLSQHIAETYPDQGQYVESIGNKGWGNRLLETGWTRDPADGGFSVYRTPDQIQAGRIQDIQTRIDAAKARMGMSQRSPLLEARALGGRQSLRQRMAGGMSRMGGAQIIDGFDVGGRGITSDRLQAITRQLDQLPIKDSVIQNYPVLEGGQPQPASLRPRLPGAPPTSSPTPGGQWWEIADRLVKAQLYPGGNTPAVRRAALRTKLQGMLTQYPEAAAQINQQLADLDALDRKFAKTPIAAPQAPQRTTPAPTSDRLQQIANQLDRLPIKDSVIKNYPARQGGYPRPQPLTPRLPAATAAQPYPYRPSAINTPGSLDYRIETASQRIGALQGAKAAEVPMIEGGYSAPAPRSAQLPPAPNAPAYAQQPRRLPAPADLSRYRRTNPATPPTATPQRMGDLARQIGTLENVPGGMTPTRAKAIESLTAQYQTETGRPYTTDYPPLETGQPQPAPLRPRLPGAPSPQPYPYQPNPAPAPRQQFRDLPPQPGSADYYRYGADQIDADRRFRDWHQSIRDMRASARENLRVPGTIGAKPAPITSFANPINPPAQRTPLSLDVPRPMTGSEVALAEAYARNPNAGYRAAELPGNGVTVYQPAQRARNIPAAAQDLRMMGEIRRLQQQAAQLPAQRTPLRNPPAIASRNLPATVAQPTRQLPFSFSQENAGYTPSIEAPRALPQPIQGRNLTPSGSPRNLPVSATRNLPATIEAPTSGGVRPGYKTPFDFWSSYPVGNTNRPGTPPPAPVRPPSRIPGMIGVGASLIPVAQEFARAQDQGASVPRSLLRGGIGAVSEAVRFGAEPIAEGIKSAIQDLPEVIRATADVATGNFAAADARSRENARLKIARQNASAEWWSSLPERLTNKVLGTERDPYSDVMDRANQRYSQAVANRRLQIDPRTGAVRAVDRGAAPPSSFDAQLRREAQASQAARNARLQAHQQHIARIQADQNARQATIERANQNIAAQRRIGIGDLSDAVAHKFFGDLGGAQAMRNLAAAQGGGSSSGGGGGGFTSNNRDARIQRALADYQRRNAGGRQFTSIEQGGSGISLGGGGGSSGAASFGGLAIVNQRDRSSDSSRSQSSGGGFDASSIPPQLRPQGDAFNEMSPRERAGITREFGGLLREGVRSQDRRYTSDQRLVGTRDTNDTRRDIAGIQSGDRRYAADRGYEGRVRVAQIGGDSRRYAADQGYAGRTYAADRSYDARIGAADITSSRALQGRSYAADQALRGRVYAADQGFAGRAYAADRAATARLGAADITGQYKVAAADLKGGYDLEKERNRNLYGQSAARMAALTRAFAIRY